MDHIQCSSGNRNHHEISPDDLISRLPNDILLKILTLLTTREAAQTSILSHRWLDLWKEVPLLDFEDLYDRYFKYETANKNVRKVAKCVQHVLQVHKSPYLRAFRLFCYMDNRYQPVIDKWLEFAFSRRIQHLHLGFWRRIMKSEYAFPHHLLNQCEKSSKDLAQAGHFGYSLPPKVDFACLKSLFLRGINITGETIELFLLKSPFLESVSVTRSLELVNLVVSGPSLRLKKLLICDCLNVESITISNSNLVYLKISEITKGSGLTLSNVPMLNEVRIDGRLYNLSSQLSCCCLSQPKVLTIGFHDPNAVLAGKRFPVLRNIRRLVVIFCEWDDQPLVRLVSWMSACPYLIEFVFKKKVTVEKDPVLDLSCKVGKEHEQVSFQCLKLVEMQGYEGRACEDELVMTIIENAVALEKIVIVPHKNRLMEGRKHAGEQLQCLVPRHLQFAIL